MIGNQNRRRAQREEEEQERRFDRSSHGIESLSDPSTLISRLDSGEPLEILEGIKAGAVAVLPPGLERIPADQLPAD